MRTTLTKHTYTGKHEQQQQQNYHKFVYLIAYVRKFSGMYIVQSPLRWLGEDVQYSLRNITPANLSKRNTLENLLCKKKHFVMY